MLNLKERLWVGFTGWGACQLLEFATPLKERVWVFSDAASRPEGCTAAVRMDTEVRPPGGGYGGRLLKATKRLAKLLKVGKSITH